MSYLPSTVLRRIDEKGDALDVVRVVGTSPIKESTIADWVGAPGDHTIVSPVEEFGANEVFPVSILQSEYVVESVPDTEPETPPLTPHQVQDQMRTPEQQFAEAERRVEAGRKALQAEPAEVTT